MNNFWKWEGHNAGILGVLASKDVNVYQLYEMIKERGDDFIYDFEDVEDFAGTMINKGSVDNIDVEYAIQPNEFIVVDWDDWFGPDYDEYEDD